MTSASWQPDPSGRHETRWWDGQRWTDHVNDYGLTSVDPLAPAAPSTVLQPPPSAPAETMAQTRYEPAYPPTMQQPTLAQPMYQPQPQWGGSGRAPANRLPLVIGGVVAVIAIGVGAFFLLNSDPQNATTTTATTVPGTTVVETTQAQTTTSTTTTTTTLPPVAITGQLLVSVMPFDTEVPKTWKRYAEPDAAPKSQSGPGIGFCGGTNSVGRAQLADSTAVAYGPGWDLPDQTRFKVDLYAFSTGTDAADYITAILKDANACTGSPVQFTVTEAAAKWFGDPKYNTAQWAVEESSRASKESGTKASEAVQAFVDDAFSTTVSGKDFAVTTTTLLLFERWGNVVVAYSLYGRWGYTGWDQPSKFEHHPTADELFAAANEVRGGLITRLNDAKAITAR